jgi:hypothetical protein
MWVSSKQAKRIMIPVWAPRNTTSNQSRRDKESMCFSVLRALDSNSSGIFWGLLFQSLHQIGKLLKEQELTLYTTSRVLKLQEEHDLCIPNEPTEPEKAIGW